MMVKIPRWKMMKMRTISKGQRVPVLPVRPVDHKTLHLAYRVQIYLLLTVLMILGSSFDVVGKTDSSSATSSAPRDGQHDFDFETGSWKTHLKRLVHPLTGSTTWVECDGTTVVRKVWEGKANLLELEADCPAGHFEGLNLRLYNRQSHQWSLNFSNSNDGTLSQPMIGEFKNGRGEFFDQEPLNGRAILVRFVITDVSPNSARFEQSFSDDGGKTWEANWIATDTRIMNEFGQTP